MEKTTDNTHKSENKGAANEFSEKPTEFAGTASFTDQRPSAISQRKLQDAIQNSPRLQQQKAQQAMMNTPPKKEKGIVQKKLLTAAEAATTAKASYDANQNNRAGMTDDWVTAASVPQAIVEWQNKGAGDLANNWIGGPSISNGGANRPPSFDLKVRDKTAAEAHFIFHVPNFANLGALVTWLMTACGLQAKLNRIGQFKGYNLSTQGIYFLREIKDTPPIDITALTNHFMYQASSAEILQADPLFLQKIQQNQIDPANADLDALQKDDTLNERIKKDDIRLLVNSIKAKLGQLKGVLPQNSKDFDSNYTPGIKAIIREIGEKFEELRGFRLTHKRFMAEFEMLQKHFAELDAVRDEFKDLKARLQHLTGAMGAEADHSRDTYDNYFGAYTEAVNQCKRLKPQLHPQEDAEFRALIAPMRAALKKLGVEVVKAPAVKRTISESSAAPGGGPPPQGGTEKKQKPPPPPG